MLLIVFRLNNRGSILHKNRKMGIHKCEKYNSDAHEALFALFG
jgi:hypothetical protein